jgi:hypothetical protein
MSHSLLVVQVEPPQNENQGDYYYRTYAPGVAMACEPGVWVVTLTNVHRKKQTIMNMADVLVLKNISDPDLLPLTNQRTLESKITVFEIADDLNALQPWNPVYAFFKSRENISTLYHLARRCDALQVTVPELYRLYGRLNDHCAVFQNQILHPPPDRFFPEGGKVIIGWGGSHGHMEDIAAIATPLIKWLNQRPNVHLHLMCSAPIWNLFDAIPHIQKKHTPPGSLDDYYRFLSEIHIGIGPLLDTAFNRSRSDVKFLEYAVSNVIPVMAGLEPYVHTVKHGRTGFLFSNMEECLQILDQLIEDPTLCRNISKSARLYVLGNRLQTQHAKDRIRFYESLMGDWSTIHVEGEAYSRHFQEWALLDGAVREGRYLNLLPSQFEMLLHDGLVVMQMNRDRRMAHECFMRASCLEPDNYLPFLYGAAVSADPIDNLKKAVQRMPHSIKARILLGQEYAKRGEIQAAFESFDSAALIDPAYEVPYLKAALLLQAIGQPEQSEALLQKANALKTQYSKNMNVYEVIPNAHPSI